MTYTWTTTQDPLSPEAAEILSEEFSTQAEAESWIEDTFEDLLDLGVDELSLREGTTVLYGPMPLKP